jgi:hypothetical protein
MSEVTRILSAIEQGDPRAAEQLFPLVYQELRQLAEGEEAGIGGQLSCGRLDDQRHAEEIQGLLPGRL